MNLLEIGKKLDRPWMQDILGHVNGIVIRLVKYYGEYPFHRHDGEQFVLLIEGDIDIQEEEKVYHLKPLDFHVVPSNVWHRPIAKKPSLVLVAWKRKIKTEIRSE